MYRIIYDSVSCPVRRIKDKNELDLVGTLVLRVLETGQSLKRFSALY